MAEFKVFQGRSQLGSYRFNDGCVRIGRHPECEIQLTDSSVSRNHAEVNRKGDAWVLKISQSRNGMFVNGNMISFRVLKSGDRIEISHFVIQFEDGATDESTVEPGAVNSADGSGAIDDGDSTTVAISLRDALKIHNLNAQVMGAHVGWYGDGDDENIVSLKGNRTLIGSTEDCQIQVAPRPGCIGLCAAIDRSDAGFELEALEDAGPLKVNAQPVVGKLHLKDGDRIMWGSYILQFRESMK